jgi:uncharacterized protein (DUF1330 family)
MLCSGRYAFCVNSVWAAGLRPQGVIMPAYMISFVTVHDLDWVADYLAAVPAMVRDHGGEFLAVSKFAPDAIERLEGAAPIPQSIVVFRFPSMDAIKGFLNSPEYGPYKDARIAATESNFFAFEHDPAAPQLIGG